MSNMYPPLAEHIILYLPFTSESFHNPHPLLPLIYHTLTESSLSALTIIFSTPSQPQLYTELRANPSAHWESFQTFLGKVYATLAAAQWACGRVLMDVEVRFVGEDGDWEDKLGLERWDDTQVGGVDELDVEVLPKPSFHLPNPYHSLHSFTPPLQSATYPVVALGGTFDHLHAAHKLLLHLALFLATRKLIVGVMSDSLLQSKSNATLVEPLVNRIASVKAFLHRCGTDCGVVESDVVEIHDPLGPTAWDSDIQALVVSQETSSGGEYVNKVRLEKGLPRLDMFVIDVISHKEEEEDDIDDRRSSEVRTLDLRGEPEHKLKDLKMGSTAIRQWIIDQKGDAWV